MADGRVSLDAFVRDFITAHLGFWWVETPDGKTAHSLERTIQRGEWEHGKPLLNPL